MRMRTVIWAGFVGAIVAACGGDDDDKGGGPSGAGSYGAIADAIAKPTGTVEAGNATNIADEYGKIMANGAPGASRVAQSQTIDRQCSNGGKLSMTATSDGKSSATSNFKYDNCCESASCCLNGSGTWYYSIPQQGQPAAEYTYCGSYDVTATCGGSSSAMKYEGCLGSGGWSYVVRVGGKTYAVTGSYDVDTKSGSLTIKGANGTFTCEYENGSGSCTGSSGTFEF